MKTMYTSNAITKRRRGHRTINVVAAAVAMTVFSTTGSTQTPADEAAIARLGPDGFAALPPSLDIPVDGSDAAVVGRIVGTHGITLREVDNPYSDKKSLFGYAGYRIAIDDVVFTRNPSDAPSLVVGTEIDVDQKVGRDAARRFVARQIPVKSGDTCLLFLLARPHGWTLLSWHVQFRKSVGPGLAAESLGGAQFSSGVTPEWLGSSVRSVQAEGGNAAPEWTSLIAEVRKLGARPPRLRPR